MKDKDHRGKRGQLNEHSLPGTNQAGKGPGSCDKNDQVNRPDGEGAPGTNQSGKRPTKPDADAT